MRRLLAAYGPKMLEMAPGSVRRRPYLHVCFTTTYNIAKFHRLGYTDANLDGGRGSDRLVDELVFGGDLDTIVRKLHDHLDAGAD